MAAKKGGLGRGFDALFEDNTAASLSSDNAIVELALSDVEPNRDQPRKVFDEEALQELADSIREHGVLQPLIVRPMTDGSYQIVAGERRWRASRMAGLTTVPAIVRTLDDREVALIALVENIQREDLGAIEQARGVRRLIDEYELTQEQAADQLGFARSTVTNLLRLMTLPEDVQDMVQADALSAGHARALLGLEDPDNIRPLADRAAAEKLSVREVEKLVRQLNAGAKKTPPKPKPGRDAFYDEVELSLAETLGRRIAVKPGKKGGVIEIEFFDKDDLAAVAKQFATE